MVYYSGFHALLPLGASLPPLLPTSPLPCLRAPPVSPACLGNPCLPVARETTSLATSRLPYDMYARGKGRFLPLAEAVGGSDVPTPKNSVCSSHGTRVPRRVWRRVQALTAERGGRHQASPDNCSTHSHSVGVQHLLFAKPCAKHSISFNRALSLQGKI